MKQRSILVTLLLCVLLLTGCSTAAPAPDATPATTQEAAATPTPTPDPLSTLPYEDGQLYAAAYLGYLEPKDLDFFRQTYFGGRELPVHHISDGDFYLIIPRDPNATVRLLRNDMLTQTSSVFYEQPDGSPFVIGCNVSDIFPDVTVEITASDGEKVSFSPFISLEDGSVEVGERGLNITRISTAPWQIGSAVPDTEHTPFCAAVILDKAGSCFSPGFTGRCFPRAGAPCLHRRRRPRAAYRRGSPPARHP